MSGFVRGSCPANFSQLKPRVAARIMPGIKKPGKPNLRKNSRVGIFGLLFFASGIKMIIKYLFRVKYQILTASKGPTFYGCVAENNLGEISVLTTRFGLWYTRFKF